MSVAQFTYLQDTFVEKFVEYFSDLLLEEKENLTLEDKFIRILFDLINKNELKPFLKLEKSDVQTLQKLAYAIYPSFPESFSIERLLKEIINEDLTVVKTEEYQKILSCVEHQSNEIDNLKSHLEENRKANFGLQEIYEIKEKHLEKYREKFIEKVNKNRELHSQLAKQIEMTKSLENDLDSYKNAFYNLRRHYEMQEALLNKRETECLKKAEKIRQLEAIQHFLLHENTTLKSDSDISALEFKDRFEQSYQQVTQLAQQLGENTMEINTDLIEPFLKSNTFIKNSTENELDEYDNRQQFETFLERITKENKAIVDQSYLDEVNQECSELKKENGDLKKVNINLQSRLNEIQSGLLLPPNVLEQVKKHPLYVAEKDIYLVNKEEYDQVKQITFDEKNHKERRFNDLFEVLNDWSKWLIDQGEYESAKNMLDLITNIKFRSKMSTSAHL